MKPPIHFAPDLIRTPVHPISIAVIGCGGTGSQVLTQLARIHLALTGLGKPGLFVHAFDPDIVTNANLGRQMFSISDVDANKAEVLISRINRFFGLDWEAIPGKYERQEQCFSNITISCVDKASERHNIHSIFKKAKRTG